MDWISVKDNVPESGEHVLLACETASGGQYVCDGFYAKYKSITSGYGEELATEYDDETDNYYLLEGYYEVINNWDDYSSIFINDFVTHWMLMPETPTKGESKMPINIEAFAKKLHDLENQKEALEKEIEKERKLYEIIKELLKPYICGACKGEGIIRSYNMENIRNTIICNSCKGSGVKL